jgi:ABC-2 type transport system ATP-binding protein
MTAIIQAQGLTKRFGRTEALRGVDLEVSAGRVVALLGPNGAGKTTFVRAVATLVRPDAGSLVVGGFDAVRQPARVRQVIGLAGQHAAVEEAMTGRENLELVGRLFGLDRRSARAAAGAVLDQLGLADDADRLVREYSGGMRRRVDLGASLVGSPRVLLLDEPTTGIDPRSRLELWDAINALVAAGTDVLLTTQYLDEADRLAADIVIIDHGTVVAAGTPDELKRRTGRDVVDVRVHHDHDIPAVADALDRIGGEPVIDADGRRVSVGVGVGSDRLVEAVRLLDAAGVVVDDIALRRPTLDEVFLSLTGRPLETSGAAPDGHAA